MANLHPSVLLFALAGLVFITRGTWRHLILLGGVSLACVTAWGLSPDAHWMFQVANVTLDLLRVDDLSHIFALIFSLAAALGCLYALRLQQSGELAACLAYAGASLGVVFAGDLITLFVFWELMAVASLFVIWYGGSARSRAAGQRYLMVHIVGGSMLLCGILFLQAESGDLTIRALTAAPHAYGTAFWFILIGVAINAAVPPLHAWLTDAYPEASPGGSVFLSVFTTKTAIYVLLRLFPGAELLLWAGVIMTLYGVIYAVLASDIRTLLAYHIVSQVGYMVTAVGMGTPLALYGAVAHAVCHILYKSLLFMGAGAMIQATGQRNLSQLGGVARLLPGVMLLYMVGAVSISGVPLFNGFMSKSIIISAAAEQHLPVAELLLTLASIGTFFSVGLKIPYYIWWGEKRTQAFTPVPRNMLLAMGMCAFLCLILGLFPDILYHRLPYDASYHPYTIDHLVSSIQLLLGTGLAFLWLRHKLHVAPVRMLDTDWFYRKPLLAGVTALTTWCRDMGRQIEAMRQRGLSLAARYVNNPFLLFQYRGIRLEHADIPLTSATKRDHEAGNVAYDEDRFRLPIGMTIFSIVIFFVFLVYHALIL